MDKEKFRQLNQERRRLQGSVNYWALHIKGWQASLAKHADKERWQANAQNRLAYAEQRHAEATSQHAKISAELYALDPEGSTRRQLQSTREQLAHARHELDLIEQRASNETQPEAIAYWQPKIEKLRNSATRYAERAQQLAAIAAADRQQQLDQAKANRLAEQQKQRDLADHWTVVSNVYDSTVDETKELQRLYEAKYGPYTPFETKKDTRH